MHADQNLQFIRDKIYSLRNAIMYSMQCGNTFFPHSFVRIIKLDEKGQLWFLCSRPENMEEQVNCDFPVRLHLFRRGIFFHMEVSGKASIIDSPSKLTVDEEPPLLVKMNISEIAYTEPGNEKTLQKISWIERGLQWLAKLLPTPRTSKPIFR